MSTVRAWHFVGETLRDGRPIPRDGQWLVHKESRDEADKIVCARRRIVARMDATDMLRYFSRQQALSVIHLWRGNPPNVVLDYLMTGKKSIRVAAWAAARKDFAALVNECFEGVAK